MKRGQIIVGFLLITFGIIALVEAVFRINLWRFIGPIILIGVGVLLIMRPRVVGSDVQVRVPVLGDIRKTGQWVATQHEFWWFVGTNYLDFTQADIPSGEAFIKIFGFVTDVKLICPQDVGIRVNSIAFVSEFKGFERKEEQFLNSLEVESPNFIQAEKHIIVEIISFVSEISVRSS